MAKVIQLDFFEDTEMSALKAEISDLRAALDRQRKSQFAKIGETKKIVEELVARMDIIERHICRS